MHGNAPLTKESAFRIIQSWKFAVYPPKRLFCSQLKSLRLVCFKEQGCQETLINLPDFWANENTELRCTFQTLQSRLCILSSLFPMLSFISRTLCHPPKLSN